MKALRVAWDFTCALVLYLLLLAVVFGGVAYFFTYGFQNYHTMWAWTWHIGPLVLLAVLLAGRMAAFSSLHRRMLSSVMNDMGEFLEEDVSEDGEDE